MNRSLDFDIEALYHALDDERQARGLSWQRLAVEISDRFRGTGSRSISPSTLSGMRRRRVIEGDGVLQMLRWLDRTPESFVPGSESAATGSERLPAVDSHHILRFDARAIHAALDAQRVERALSWKDVAIEIG